MVAVFVDFLYNHFDDPGVEHDNIWSDRSSSEFKNKLMVNFFQLLSKKYISLSRGIGSHGSTPLCGGKLP